MRTILILMAVIAAFGVAAAPAGAHTTRAQLITPCDATGPFNLIVGTSAPDRLVGTDECDAIFGRRGGDVIRGKLGYDLLYGGRGPDYIVDTSFLVGGEIRGGRGYDTCVVVSDTLIELFGCENIVEL